MSLYQTQYPNNSRVVSGTPAIFKDDVVLLCDTSLGAVTINLLEIPDNYWNTTWKLYVVDNSSNASVNNITINAGSGQTINGASSITLSTNDESAVIRISSNNQFIATLSIQGGGGGSSIIVKDEGTQITPSVSSFDFVGDLVIASAVGNDVTVNVNQYDSGWLQIPYYNTYTQGTYGIANIGYQPMLRVVGRQVFIHGLIQLPLADLSGNLNNYFGNYPSSPSVNLYTGTDGGYQINSNYSIVSKSAILPTNLLPLNTVVLTTNAFIARRIITDPCISFSSPPYEATTKIPVITYFYNFFITNQGKFFIYTLPYLESDNSTFLNPYSDLRRVVSKFNVGDLVNDYTNYRNSYTGALSNAATAATGITYQIAFDPDSPSNHGGFQFQVNSSYFVSENVTQNQIINAVDNLYN